ncbi:eukaryotic translation initiation factor 3 subunit [Nannochloropsis gaditana]|uniref:Eukaryotic translation initiation factor 3 subunit n=1 Tax=Nannochloropsis gaditana TaxID=72520 RepID=W7TF98_9STRA|nr:eukaryotic translation initiation factor 3 subunit [Nannochloropsis gaditana]
MAPALFGTGNYPRFYIKLCVTMEDKLADLREKVKEGTAKKMSPGNERSFKRMKNKLNKTSKAHEAEIALYKQDPVAYMGDEEAMDGTSATSSSSSDESSSESSGSDSDSEDSSSEERFLYGFLLLFLLCFLHAGAAKTGEQGADGTREGGREGGRDGGGLKDDVMTHNSSFPRAASYLVALVIEWRDERGGVR